MPNFGGDGIVDLTYYDYEDREMRSDGQVSLDLVARNVGFPGMAVILQGIVNTGSPKQFSNGEKVGKLLQEAHLTTQGQLVNFLLGILAGLGDQPVEYTDPRNRTAILAARKIKAMVENGEIKLQPLV